MAHSPFYLCFQWVAEKERFLCKISSCYSVVKSCPTLCNPVNCSPPGSSVHGILQARKLEWVVISFSRGPSQPRDWAWVSSFSCIGRWIVYQQGSPTTWLHCINNYALQADSLLSEPPGKPLSLGMVFNNPYWGHKTNKFSSRLPPLYQVPHISHLLDVTLSVLL